MAQNHLTRIDDVKLLLLSHDWEREKTIELEKEDALEILELIEKRDHRRRYLRARYEADRENQLQQAHERYIKAKKAGITYYQRNAELVKQRRIMREMGGM